MPKSLAISRIGPWGVSSMIAWTFLMNSLVRGLPGGVLLLHHLQRVVRCIELCPQALNLSDLHFEGAGNFIIPPCIKTFFYTNANSKETRHLNWVQYFLSNFLKIISVIEKYFIKKYIKLRWPFQMT